MTYVDDPLRLQNALNLLERQYKGRFTVWRTDALPHQLGVNIPNIKDAREIQNASIAITQTAQVTAESAGLEALTEGPVKLDTMVLFVGLRLPDDPPKGHEHDYRSVKPMKIVSTVLPQNNKIYGGCGEGCTGD